MTELRICEADLLESLYLLLMLKSTKTLKAIREQEGATNTAVVYVAQLKLNETSEDSFWMRLEQTC